MIILSIKTNQEISEIGLFKLSKKLDYTKWQAHRELSVTIHDKIEELLAKYHLTWQDIEGIIFYEGPGSFTGLRIGASVVNAVAASLDIPIAQATGERWINKSLKSLHKEPSKRIAVPDYGGAVHTTKPRK